MFPSPKYPQRSGFSLIEVVLAIGIFLVTVLALVGLLGPTLQSVDEVEQADEIASVVNTVNAFLQSSSDIAPGASKFDAIYNAVRNNGHATLFVYQWFEDVSGSDPIVKLEIGFEDNDAGTINNEAVVNTDTGESFGNAAGTIYRVVLTPSSVNPAAQVTDNGAGAYPRYALVNPLATYSEGYFAMEVRIFAREPDMSAVQSGTMTLTSAVVTSLANEDAIFTYNTAIVR